MSIVDELIKKSYAKNDNPEYWFALEKEIIDIFKGDYPDEEKRRLKKDWCLRERVCMICDGYRMDLKEKGNEDKQE